MWAYQESDDKLFSIIMDSCCSLSVWEKDDTTVRIETLTLKNSDQLTSTAAQILEDEAPHGRLRWEGALQVILESTIL